MSDSNQMKMPWSDANPAPSGPTRAAEDPRSGAPASSGSAAPPASDPPGAADPRLLRAELTRSLLRALQSEVTRLNADLFRRKLNPANIEIVASAKHLGRWVPQARTIEIAEHLILSQPWGVVIEVLKHEMAHQYVHEVMGLATEAAHGPAFRDLCKRLRIDASATGLPKAAPDAEERKVFDRIAKLLALAESPNQNEAQAAMAAAQRLMLKHNVEHLTEQVERGYTFRHLGHPTGRVTEAERIIGGLLSAHFFVQCIWVPDYNPHLERWRQVLEVCGTPANVEMADYVYGFLMHTSDRLWQDHKRRMGISGDRDRLRFVAGVMMGFYSKLEAEKLQQQKEGIVWVKDGDLDDYYASRHPRVTHVRHRGARRTAAHAHGVQAGKSIDLHKPVGGSEGGPKLLPGKR